MDIDETEHIKTNREKRLSPKQDGYYWCDKCDRSVVNNWKKCKICGFRSGVKTLKKDT